MTAIPPIQSWQDFERITLDLLRPAPPESKFGAVRFGDIDRESGEEFEFLIDGWLSRYDRSILAGPSGSGKSFLAIHASMCVARGVPFFGMESRKGLVMYQAGEGARGIKKRLRAYRQHFGMSEEEIETTPFVMLAKQVDLYRADGDTPGLIEEINRWKSVYEEPLELIVIDTLATATAGADENSGKDMGLVLANIARIANECGAHVMLVHHMNAAATKVRGHSSIRANIDQVVEVDVIETKETIEQRDDGSEYKRVTKIRKAVLSKQKDDEDGLNFRFQLKSVKVGWDPKREKDITSCVVIPESADANEKIDESMEKRGAKLTPREKRFFAALLEALRRHGISPPDGLKVGRDVREVVTYDEMKSIYAALNPYDGPADLPFEELKAEKARWAATTRQALFSARNNLAKPEVNVIQIENPYIWWTGRPVQGFHDTFPKRKKETALLLPSPIDESDEIAF